MGSTSKSKSKRSPSSICVWTSMPIFIGTKRGVGGLSMNASVCVVTSDSGTVSTSSSRYCSVCMSMCRRPSTGSGVRGGFERVLFVGFNSGPVECRDCAAYVLPRITRLSYMIFAG